MRVKLSLIFLSLAISLAAWSCASSTTPEISTSGNQAQSTAVFPLESSQKLSKEKDWDKILAAARQEGTLIWLTSVGPEIRQAISQAFKDKYGLRVESITLLGAEMVTKLKRERQAGIYTADIITGGSTTLTNILQPQELVDPIEPSLVLPEVTDKSKWWQNKLPTSGYGTGVAIVKSPSVPLLINTKFVKPEDIKSYKDLLQPKFKGKILMDEPIGAGKGLKWNLFILKEFPWGEGFLRELMKQEIVISRDRRLLTEWIVREKFWITIGPRLEMTQPFLELGASLALPTPSEGDYATAGGGFVSVVNRAPHPNASKVFANWILTKEGTILWSRYQLYQSSRLDAPADFLPSLVVRQPGIKYFDSDVEEWEEFMVKQRELLQDIYAPILK